MKRFVRTRRLALVGVLLASQFLTACCVLPPFYGGGHGGRHGSGLSDGRGR